MGAFSGPETVDDGIVLALDAQNPLSVGNTSVNVWEDVVSSTTTVSSVGVITCLSVDIASNQFFGQKYSSCLISGSTVWDNRPPSVSDVNEILSGNLTCKSYQTGTYDQVQYLFGAYGNAGNVCTLRFTGFGVGALIGVGGYFSTGSRQCRLTGDLQNSPVTITSPSGGFADPIVLTSDPADIQFSNPGSSGDPMYVYWLGPYNQVPYNTLRSNYGTLTNGPVLTQEPKLEPFGDAGAVQFDGTGDYLQAPLSLNPNTSNFTIECFIYLDTAANEKFIVGALDWFWFSCSYTGGSSGVTSGKFGLSMRDSANSNWYSVSSTTSFASGRWYHVAATWDGTYQRMFVDGVLEATSVDRSAITWASKTTNVDIGGYSTNTSFTIDGFISNLRIIVGTALYTSNFTPKRQPLLPESAPNTVLLTCQKGTIRDRSSSAHAITVNGNAKSISGASYFEFDGTDDYVQVPNSSALQLGTGDFTIEMWWYMIGSGNCRGFTLGDASDANGMELYVGNSGASLYVYIQNAIRITADSVPSFDAWHHYVIERTSGTMKLYIDGVVQSGTYSSSQSLGTGTDGDLRLGVEYYSSSLNFVGDCKISNFKIYKNKGFTAEEVQQNYNALKGRYV